jgi:hypothetical protein
MFTGLAHPSVVCLGSAVGQYVRKVGSDCHDNQHVCPSLSVSCHASPRPLTWVWGCWGVRGARRPTLPTTCSPSSGVSVRIRGACVKHSAVRNLAGPSVPLSTPWAASGH